MVNQVTLIGRVGQDPEIKHMENGVMVGRFSLATNERYQDKSGEWIDQTEWHNVVVWRWLAEKAEKQLKKGNLVYVEGKVTYRKYKDKEGVERSITDIVAKELRSLEKRDKLDPAALMPTEDYAPPARNNANSNPAPASASNSESAPAPNPAPAAAPKATAAPTSGPNDPPPMPEGGDDLPF